MIRRIAVLGLVALIAACGEDGGDSLTVGAWGGAYTRACKLAYYEPFIAETGIVIRDAQYNGGLAEVRAQVDVGRIHWDVVPMEIADAVRGCDEGCSSRSIRRCGLPARTELHPRRISSPAP